MKKLMFILSIFFTSILITSAAPCKVISGDGTNIGDEIQCGTESFYVLSNDGENIEMLAKYNLYVGSTYYKVEFDQTFETWIEASNYFEDNYSTEYDGFGSSITDENGEYYGAIVYKYLDYNEVKQSEEAIGAHGNLKVEPLFPEIGVYNYFVVENDYFHGNYIWPTFWEHRNDEGGFTDFEINLNSTKEGQVLEWFLEYEKTLNSLNIDVIDITMLSVSDINKIVLNVTGKEMPLEEWWNNRENWGYVNSEPTGFEIVGSIKDLMPEGYEWLWSTTYWTRTLPTGGEYQLYFIDTMGDLCNSHFCTASVGAGIRPVVTIPAYLIYSIETKTDGNGTVEADHVEAEGGTEIKFTVTPNEGYVLSVVKVTDANGNVITFTDYTFTMPNANVLIEATFVPIPEDNPETSDILAIVCTVFVISGILLTYMNYKKNNIA